MQGLKGRNCLSMSLLRIARQLGVHYSYMAGNVCVFCLLTDRVTDNVGGVLLHGQLHRLFNEAMQKVLEEPVLLRSSQRSLAMKKSFKMGQ